jgi:hypothetical protein
MKWIALLSVLFLNNIAYAIELQIIPGSDYLQVTGSHFDRFIVKDKNALAKYDKIIFSMLKFDEFKISKSGNKQIDKTWVLTQEDKDQFAGQFKTELLNVYAGDKAQQLFGLGEGKASNILLARAELLTLLPLTAKYGENVSGNFSTETLESFGSLTMRITLTDSETNAFVAIVEDGKNLTVSANKKSVSNKSTNAYAWNSAFHRWLEDLRESLVELKAKQQ